MISIRASASSTGSLPLSFTGILCSIHLFT
jgi:hypothetical protein